MIDLDLLLGPGTLTLILGLVVMVLLYWSSVRNYSYWKNRGVPSANAIPILGSLYEGYRKPLQDMEYDRYIKLGRIYGHYEASSPVLSVAEPALLRKILVKDFEYFHDRRVIDVGVRILNSMITGVPKEDWKRIRSIITPTFSNGKVIKMLNIFKECSTTLCQNFKNSAEASKRVEVKKLYGAFTMDVIASSAFSMKIDSLNSPDNTFVQMAKRTFTGGFTLRFLLFLIAPWLMKAFKIPVFEQEPFDFFENVTHQVVEERRKSGKIRNDFLQLLIDSAKEVSEEEKWDIEDMDGDITSNYPQEQTKHDILETVTSKHLTMDELVAQCIVFFVAGYYTTSATLALATYSLAVNPEVQEKLRKEVDDVLKENNGEMTYEAIQSMKYLDNVISETLRMYPPAVRLERVASADYKLGDTGITVPKGMFLSIPIYALHRDAEFFPEPLKFDPDRFTTEERSKRNPYTYLPFGAGPRNCLAMRFALLEIKICIAHVIANFNIKRCSETKVPLEFCIGHGILQPRDVTLEVEVRKDSPSLK